MKAIFTKLIPLCLIFGLLFLYSSQPAYAVTNSSYSHIDTDDSDWGDVALGFKREVGTKIADGLIGAGRYVIKHPWKTVEESTTAVSVLCVITAFVQPELAPAPCAVMAAKKGARSGQPAFTALRRFAW